MKSKKKSIILRLLLALCAFFVMCAGVALYAFSECFYNSKRRRTSTEKCYQNHKKRGEAKICQLIDNIMQRPSERIEITSHDGLNLVGHYYHVKDGAPIEIGFHGYRSDATRDFCGGSVTCLENGVNLLLVDQRAHGNSEGTTISFGVNERRDCEKWVEYVKKRFGHDVRIVLAGVSMGAGTVLMASELDFGGNVKCIVADCPYSDQGEIIKRICKKRKYEPHLIYPFIKMSAKTFGKFDLEECSPIKAVANTKIPILFIHGTEDDFVPCQMSKDLYDACSSPKQLLLVEGASHAMSYIVDEKVYKNTVREFFDKYLM